MTARDALVAVALLLAAGCATVPRAEHDAVLEENLTLAAELGVARLTVLDREEEIARLEARIASLEAAVERADRALAGRTDDLTLTLNQLGVLREERLDLREDLARLEAEVRRLSGRDGDAAAQPADGTPSPQRLSPAPGVARLVQVEQIGLQADLEAGNRLAGGLPGVAVDTTGTVPVMFDTRPDYAATAVYLTIHDPAGRRPRLVLTVQYVTDQTPLLAEAALIAIEGVDPVDPVDPIVLSGGPARETDGALVREAFTVTVDAQLFERLATMLTSARFTATFVGPDGRVTHRPGVPERAAMSNILFAFMDLGGLR